MTELRHFLDLKDLDLTNLRTIIDQSRTLKSGHSKTRTLEGKTLAMIFDKPSTRTRVSFDIGMRQLGGETLYLSSADLQLGRGETIGDTAKVLSRYVDVIVIRTNDHSRLIEFAENASVPVINGLTDDSHPCQIMADIMTFEEHRGAIANKKIAWTGDGNNVLTSFIHAAARFGFSLHIATPEALKPGDDILHWAAQEQADITLTNDPFTAVNHADCIVTDTFVSMGDREAERRHNLLMPYQVNETLMSAAKPDALFMHCLPAHRGEEVTSTIIDGPQSVVFDEAENRLHAQKGILAWCLGKI